MLVNDDHETIYYEQTSVGRDQGRCKSQAFHLKFLVEQSGSFFEGLHDGVYLPSVAALSPFALCSFSQGTWDASEMIFCIYIALIRDCAPGEYLKSHSTSLWDDYP
jgi:hypothetical protein